MVKQRQRPGDRRRARILSGRLSSAAARHISDMQTMVYRSKIRKLRTNGSEAGRVAAEGAASCKGPACHSVDRRRRRERRFTCLTLGSGSVGGTHRGVAACREFPIPAHA